MRIIQTLLAASTFCIVSTVQAGSCDPNIKLCVPGDFPSPSGANFNMDLLAGNVYIDFGNGNGTLGGFALGNLQAIAFHASPFSNPGNNSVGTSTLDYASINHYTIGTILVFGYTAEFYLDGTGAGNLVDLDGTHGDWSLNVPLFATWNNIQFNFGQMTLSTAATYSVQSFFDDDEVFHSGFLAGQSMNYASGNAYLVGQSQLNDPTNPFNGIRITFGINANDPVIATPVPEPETIWFMLSGLSLLGVMTLRRNKLNGTAGEMIPAEFAL